jgi:acyl carrier protein
MTHPDPILGLECFLVDELTFLDMRQNLRSAIRSGVLTRTANLDECKPSVAKIIGVDSLDFVELVMAVEGKGTKLKTVDDLMRFRDDQIKSINESIGSE